MDLSELIVALQNAKAPTRKLDVEIAKLLGFKRIAEPPAPNQKNPPGKKLNWYTPDGVPGKVPPYTRLVDSARNLVNSVAPDNVGGCSWEKGRASARINDGPYVHAANPAIALCAAALQILWVQQESKDAPPSQIP